MLLQYNVSQRGCGLRAAPARGLCCRVTLVVLDVQENFNAFVRQMRVIRIFRSLKMIVRIQSLRVIVRQDKQTHTNAPAHVRANHAYIPHFNCACARARVFRRCWFLRL